MKTRYLTIAAVAVALFVFSGLAVAAEPAEKGADAAAEAVSAEFAVAKHVNDQGEEMTGITTDEFKKILAWYQDELQSRERRAQFEKELDAFEVDP